MTYSYYPTKVPIKNQSFVKKIQNLEFSIRKIDRNLFEISNKLKTLDASILPTCDPEIRPIQCDFSNKKLIEIIEIVRQSSYILEQSPLQLNDIKNKYELSVLLYYLDEQLLNLQSLISNLRPVCREESKRKTEIQNEIQEQFIKICNVQEHFQTIISK